MALRVWLPLNGNLDNNGLSPVTVTNNGATVNDAGKIGKCYQFNSTPIYGTLTGLSGWNKFSASCWVYLPQHRGSQYMFHFGGQDGWMAKFGVYTAATTGNIYLLINGVEVYSQKSLSVNTWNHITVTFDGSKLILYLNGVSAFSYTATGTFSASDHFAIGARTNSTSGTTFNYPILDNGKLNDIRIYDHCLSPREVKEISRGLVLHYKLDDPYIEPTENLNSADWVPYQAYWTIVSQTQNEIKLRKNTSTGSSNTVALKNNVLCGKISTNQTVTISGYLYKGETPYKTGRDKPTTYGGWTKISAYSDDTGYFRFTGYFTSAMTFDWLFHETLFGTGNQDGDICYIRNLQWEAKDHATPYTPSSRSAIPVYDCSGYKNDGTIVGTLTLSDDSSRYGKSTVFNGTNSYVTFGSQVSLANDHSICCWLDLTNVSAVQYFVAFTSGGGIRYSGGDNSFLYYAGGATYTWNYAKVNRFVHVSFICASNSLSLYVDGQLIGSKTRTSSANCTGIGNRSDGYYYNGKLSDFRIYSTALSADDIKELYNTSVLIHNDGTIEVFEFVETNSGSPEVTKTGLVKAQSHNEVSKNLFDKNNVAFNSDNYSESVTSAFVTVARTGKCCSAKCIPITPNTYYILSYDQTQVTINNQMFNTVFWDKSGTTRIATYTSSQGCLTNKVKYKTPADAYFVSFSNFGSLTDAQQQTLVNSLQFEEGEVYTAYQAHDITTAVLYTNKTEASQLLET